MTQKKVPEASGNYNIKIIIIMEASDYINSYVLDLKKSVLRFKKVLWLFKKEPFMESNHQVSTERSLISFYFSFSSSSSSSMCTFQLISYLAFKSSTKSIGVQFQC